MDRLIRRTRIRLLAWLRRSRQRRVSFVRRYSYNNIKRATNGFRNIIYSNSDGPSYKAKFQDGATALVKEVTACKGETDVFHREVQLLGRLHHRHLLALRGFCTGPKRLLVFDNIENGSLKDHLNDPLKTPLDWRTRLQIAIGVVAALEYLLIFNDASLYSISVSSSNVMLDDNFIAKLSDIGINSHASHATTAPRPSVSGAGGMEQKCSGIIFQLGLLILELVTGQSSDQGGSDLIQWIRESRFGSSTHKMMIDPDLGNNYSTRELKALLSVAKLCINAGDNPTFSIPQIYWYLQKVNIQRD